MTDIKEIRSRLASAARSRVSEYPAESIQQLLDDARDLLATVEFDNGQIIPLSTSHERSANFLKVEGAVSRDFDGYLTCTVLYNGMPVACMTDPRSNYMDADAEHMLPGWRPILTDDHGQLECYAHFMTWVGEAGEDFPALVSEVLGRPWRTRTSPRGHTVSKPWTIYDAFDEADRLGPNNTDRKVWLGEGYDWCAFSETLDHEMYKAHPHEWPKPRDWYGEDLA